MRPLPNLDINCDLGEGEAPARTRALMRLIDSANVACGGHAGELASMARCARLAREFDVRLGAHPGAPDRNNFGRMETRPSPAELALWVVQQAGALAHVAARFELTLHHIKLHGALYHASEADEALARAYIGTVRDHFPGTVIYSLSGGRVARMARKMGVEAREELFADRAYRPDGRLVPRSEAHAVMTHGEAVTSRLRHWLVHGRMIADDGSEVTLRGHTLCIHGDTDHSVALARALRKVVERGTL